MSGYISLTSTTTSQDVFSARVFRGRLLEIQADPDQMAATMAYGPDAGYVPLRASLARWLQSCYEPSIEITTDRLAVSHGYFYANLEAILPAFAEAGYTRNIWIAEPCFKMRWRIFAECGFEGKLRGVPEDAEGIDLGFLRDALEEVERDQTLPPRPQEKPNREHSKTYRHIIYVVPTLSAPSGKTMSLGRRQDLVRLARQFDALVVTEDSYNHIRWPQNEVIDLSELPIPPPRIVDIDRTLEGGPKDEWGNAISAGSFDTLLRPPIRTGWVEAAPALIRALPPVGEIMTMSCPFHVKAYMVYEMVQSGYLERHLRHNVIPIYRSRYNVLCRLFREHLRPLGFSLPLVSCENVTGSGSGHADAGSLTEGRQEVQVAGGVCLYINLPEDLPAMEMDFVNEATHVRVGTGRGLAVEGDPCSMKRAVEGYGRAWVLCWPYYHEESLTVAVDRLVLFVKRIRSERQGPQVNPQ